MIANGYKEKVTDEQLVNLIEAGVQNSTGDWLNSSDLARERLKSTYEFAGVADQHLSPQGVSTIVDTSTTEVIEAYTAILSDLFLNNGRIARFVPYDQTPGAHQAAKEASAITNYCIFKKNKGWEILQTWMKSALLWKNAVIRWDYVEDYDYKFEEYEEISQSRLDELLSQDNVEVVGELQVSNRYTGMMTDLQPQDNQVELVYENVRIRRTIDKSTVKLENIPPESFRISRDARTIEDAAFVGIQTDMTRSEIRKFYPEWANTIDNWDDLGKSGWAGHSRYSEEIAARKHVTGQEYWQGSNSYDMTELEANREVVVTECWLRVDRDGDGIAELKHFIIVGNHVLWEDDCDEIPLASISPIDIPFEFYGLSMADFARSSTLASTAILRGFVENTYLTNYAPKLADPNVVDFSALQNMKPKQIVPTNGNPAAAVQSMPPETISTGTVPLLQHMQLMKEQATGMSKVAQGLNDTLYVSGNSEEKLAAVQSASQKRIQHIARRFAETGFKRLIQGVYNTLRSNMQQITSMNDAGIYTTVNISSLPEILEAEIHLDIGENSNSTRIKKLQSVGQTVLPALVNAQAGMAIRPEAPAVLATQIIESMGLDSADYLLDYTQNEFKQKTMETRQKQAQLKAQQNEIAAKKAMADVALAEANVRYTHVQADNSVQDNVKQAMVAVDRHYQEWAKLVQEAQDKGLPIPAVPTLSSMLEKAKLAVDAAPKKPQPQQQFNPPQGGQ
jgi:enamine deaminase RidA (YjgF/YER057c/UK114 family)